MAEIRKHRAIGIKSHDNLLLYLANTLGCLFPSGLWKKQKKLQYLLEEGGDRIEAKLNIVKMAKNQTDLKVLMRNSMLNEDVQFNIKHSEKNYIDLDKSSESDSSE